MTEIVVKIPDDLHETIIDPNKWLTPKRVNKLVDAVLHGKILPKGHGALRDTTTIVDKLTDTDIYLTDEDWNEIGKALRSAEVLVEADKGEE